MMGEPLSALLGNEITNFMMSLDCSNRNRD